MNVICICKLNSPAAITVKAMKILRRYLFHVQSSVFQGTLTPHQFRRLQDQLNEIIDPARDQITLFYTYRDAAMYEKCLGKRKEYLYMI